MTNEKLITKVKIINGMCLIHDELNKPIFLGDICDVPALKVHDKLTALGFNNFDNRQIVILEIAKFVEREKNKEKKEEKKYQRETEERIKLAQVKTLNETIAETGFDSSLEKNLLNYLDLIKIAEEFVKKTGLIFDKNGLWWIWNKEKFKWELTDEIALFNIVDSHLQFASETLKAGVKHEVVEALKRAGRKNEPKELKKNQLQFYNKIIDLEENTIIEASQEYFSVNAIPHKLGLTTETPIMDNLLESWVGKENVQDLYEIISYCLICDYFIHIIICCIGSGSNGKSKYMGIIKRFFGTENICSVDLDSLIGSRFESSKLYKKNVCLMGETNFGTMSKTSLLKRLSGQDLIPMEFKNKNPFDAENYAKLIISTNSLPPTTDKTEGFYRRWKIIEFPNKFPEGEDVLDRIPEQEYENLCAKCVLLLKTLLKQKRFTKMETVEERAKKYEEMSNPLNSFIFEKCVKDSFEKIPAFQVYEDYCGFLVSRGLRTQSYKEMLKHIRLLGYETERENVVVNGKESKWNYIHGLRWKNKENITDYSNEVMEK